MAVSARFARFLVAGGTGFVTDIAVLSLLLEAGLPSLAARLVSIAVALFVTWRINRRLVFAAPGRGTAREFLRYAGVGASTSLLNYAVYAGLVALVGIAPLPATGIASAVALGASFIGYDRLVFRTKARPRED